MTKDEIMNYFKEVNCPICENPLVEEDGVTVCYYCGWSEDDLNE